MTTAEITLYRITAGCVLSMMFWLTVAVTGDRPGATMAATISAVLGVVFGFIGLAREARS